MDFVTQLLQLAGLWLAMGLAFSLGLRARSLGLSTVAARTVVGAPLGLLLFLPVSALRISEQIWWVLASGCWVLMAVLALGADRAARPREPHQGLGSETSSLRRGLRALGLLAALVAVLNVGFPPAAFLVIIAGWWLSGLIVAAVGFRLARTGAERAGLAWVLVVSSVLLSLIPVSGSAWRA
ncbi:MAG: hypothetical protein JW940_05300 [Polyangiaceae bacterium]|nr:hypothetical protein [Polyangiaceae bacterium]